MFLHRVSVRPRKAALVLSMPSSFERTPVKWTWAGTVPRTVLTVCWVVYLDSRYPSDFTVYVLLVATWYGAVTSTEEFSLLKE